MVDRISIESLRTRVESLVADRFAMPNELAK
jgi:hypothetical protein